MIDVMDRISLTKPLLLTLGIGLLIYFLLPVGLMLVLTVLLSAASVMDPLHAKQHVRDVWTGFAIIAGFQMLFVLAVCPLSVFAARTVNEKLSGAARWIIAIAVGIGTHWVIMAGLGLPTYLISRDEQFSAFALLFWLFTTISGPVLLLVCMASFTNAHKRKIDETNRT